MEVLESGPDPRIAARIAEQARKCGVRRKVRWRKRETSRIDIMRAVGSRFEVSIHWIASGHSVRKCKGFGALSVEAEWIAPDKRRERQPASVGEDAANLPARRRPFRDAAPLLWTGDHPHSVDR